MQPTSRYLEHCYSRSLCCVALSTGSAYVTLQELAVLFDVMSSSVPKQSIFCCLLQRPSKRNTLAVEGIRVVLLRHSTGDTNRRVAVPVRSMQHQQSVQWPGIHCNISLLKCQGSGSKGTTGPWLVSMSGQVYLRHLHPLHHLV